MRGSTLTGGIALSALLEVEAAIQGLVDHGVLDGYKGHFVVMDPNRPQGEFVFENAILAEHTLRDGGTPWKYDYVKIARAKAKGSWETGLSSRELVNDGLLVGDGDAPWAGSIVIKLKNGQILVIAFSGYSSEDDESLDWMAYGRMCALGLKRVPENTLVGGEAVTA